MEVRFFKISERQLLIDSIDRLWRHNHVYVRNPAVLEHLVLNTPYREEYAGKDNYSFIGIWDDENDVVGLQGSIPQRFNVFGREYNSLTGTVWFIDKKVKKKIKGIAMREFSLDEKMNVNAVVTFGLSDIAYKINKASNFAMIENFPRWIVVADKKAVIKNLLPDNSTENYLPVVSTVNIPQRNFIVEEEFDFVKWNKFYKEKFEPMTIGTKRDSKFLHWRYEMSPVLKYRFLAVKDSFGEYHGLAVVRLEKILNGTYTIGRILEFIAVEAEPSIALANAVVNFDANVIMWDFYCLSNITAFGLESVGFRQLPAWLDKVMMPSRFQPVDYENLTINGAIWLSDELREEINQFASPPWYFTRGDSDQDRAN